MVNAFMTKIVTTPTPTYTANVIDTSNDTTLYPSDISLANAGTYPKGVAITPDGLYAIIISQGSSGSLDSGMTVIDTVTNQVVAYGSLSGATGYAQCVATATVGSSYYAYITYAYFDAGTDDEVWRYDFTSGPPSFSSETRIDLTVPQLGPYGIAVTPNGDYVYVCNSFGGSSGQGSLSIITTGTNHVSSPYTFSSTYASYPGFVAITPDNATVYVTLQEDSSHLGQVAFFDVGSSVSGVQFVTVGKQPYGIAITPNVTGPQTVYVANYGDNTVSYFSTTSPSPALVTDLSPSTFNVPEGVAITPDGTKAYVGNSGNNTVSVIDIATHTVTRKLSSPGGCSLGMFIQQIAGQDTTFAQGVTSSWFGT